MSNLKLDVDQAGELKAAFRRGKWTNAEIKFVTQGDFLTKVREVVLKCAEIVHLDLPDNPIIRVNRLICPPYPAEANEEHISDSDIIECALTGPEEYDIRKLRESHFTKSGHCVDTSKVSIFLSDRGLLQYCLGLHDLLAIKRRGIEFTRKYLGVGRFFGWRTQVEFDKPDSYSVPFLEVRDKNDWEPFLSIGWVDALYNESLGTTDHVLFFPRKGRSNK